MPFSTMHEDEIKVQAVIRNDAICKVCKKTIIPNATIVPGIEYRQSGSKMVFYHHTCIKKISTKIL